MGIDLQTLFKRLWSLVVVALCLWLFFTRAAAAAEPVTKNDFVLNDPLVPAAEIFHGGPPRDGIPAIDQPRFVEAGEADWLKDSDRVLGMERNGVAKAYPIAILNWHEVVNDRLDGEPVAITFCPLCGTGMAFRARVAGEARDFGVSGLLYNSDVLLYDRQSDSLWSQLMRRAISGPLKGTELDMVPVSHTTWADWRQRHPDTRVLSRDTGHSRDYGRDPYAGYDEAATVFFPTTPYGRRFHPKEQVIGLELDGEFKAYPFVELAKGPARLQDRVAGRDVTVAFDPEHRSGRVLDEAGREIPTVIAFWFAWSAFHPDTQVHVVE